eukprot:tig00022104_g23815.t1
MQHTARGHAHGPRRSSPRTVAISSLLVAGSLVLLYLLRSRRAEAAGPDPSLVAAPDGQQGPKLPPMAPADDGSKKSPQREPGPPPRAERERPKPPALEPIPEKPVMSFFSAPLEPDMAARPMPQGTGLKAASTSRLALRTSEYEREYLLYLPQAMGEMPAVGKEGAAGAKEGKAGAEKLEPVPLVLVFHGMNVDMYWAALNETTWCAMAETHGLVAAFPQSQTMFFATHWDFWSMADLHYVHAVLADVDAALRPSGRVADPRRTFAVGISNGGLFVSNVAVYFSQRFAAVCNYMGGWMEGAPGAPAAKPLPAVRQGNFVPEAAARKVPTLIVIGDQDRGMMGYCRAAERVLKGAGWEVEFVLAPGVAHRYEAAREPDIWRFFQQHALP